MSASVMERLSEMKAEEFWNQQWMNKIDFTKKNKLVRIAPNLLEEPGGS